MMRHAWIFGVLMGAAVASSGCIILTGESGDGGKGNTGNNGGNGGSGGDAGSAGSAGKAGAGGDGGSVLPSSCDAVPEDDECSSCFKKSCCAELTDCANDATCASLYDQFSECFFPSDAAEPSGYSTSTCKQRVGAIGNSAEKLIDCYKTQCSSDANPACGVEEVVTWQGFAAEFTEVYCSGCHFAGFEDSGLGPVDANGVPKKTADFTCDSLWASGWGSQAPTAENPKGSKGNVDWFSTMSLANVKTSADLIRCGVAEDLPADCDEAKFPSAQRFPPVGTKADGPHCFWMPDGETCAQPTPVERHKMESWLLDGMACGEGCDVTCPSP